MKNALLAYEAAQQIAVGFILPYARSLTKFNLWFAGQLSATLPTGHLLDYTIIYTTTGLVMGESTVHVFARENDGATKWLMVQIRKGQ